MTLPDPAVSPVNELAHRFWEAVLELNPTTATLYGDERYADKLEDPSAAGRARARSLMERTAAEAAAIDTDGLPTEDRITRDMLEVIAALNIEEDDRRLHQLRVVDQMAGPQQILPQMTQFQPADTPDRLEAFLGRLRAYPAFMAANVEILREGLASGLTAPRIVAQRTIAQIERMLEVPIESAIVPAMVQGVDDEGRERVRDVVRDQVYPADQAFLEALKGDYLAATREDPGLWSAPDGETLYRTFIRSWTTLDLDPEEVHRIGLEDLDAIELERREIARKAGFGDDTTGYRASLDADTDNTPQHQGGAGRPGERGHRARDVGSRPATSASCRASGARFVRSRSTRRRTRPSPTTTRHRPTGRDPASTTPTATTCRAASTPSSRRRPTTRPRRATISRSRSRWRTSG